MQKAMRIFPGRINRGSEEELVAGNYRGTNVKFNMDDSRQREAYQILKKMKGKYSYGVIVSDALLRTYRDTDRPSNEIDRDGTIIPNNYFAITSPDFDRFAEIIVEKMMETDTMKDLIENMDDLTDDMIEFYKYGRTEEGVKRQGEADAMDDDPKSGIRNDVTADNKAILEGDGVSDDISKEDEPAEITDAMLSFACG